MVLNRLWMHSRNNFERLIVIRGKTEGGFVGLVLNTYDPSAKPAQRCNACPYSSQQRPAFSLLAHCKSSYPAFHHSLSHSSPTSNFNTHQLRARCPLPFWVQLAERHPNALTCH